MDRFGVSEEQIQNARCDDNYRKMIRFEVDRTADLFGEGNELLPLLRPAVRMQIALFGRGRRAVLSSIRRQKYDTLSRRAGVDQVAKERAGGFDADGVWGTDVEPDRRGHGARLSTTENGHEPHCRPGAD